MSFTRLKNQTTSKITTRFPLFARLLMDTITPFETTDVPWTPIEKPLTECRIALVTTVGVHHRDQTPFDMDDREGDPSFRIIDPSRPIKDLMITHDYYDHSGNYLFNKYSVYFRITLY